MADRIRLTDAEFAVLEPLWQFGPQTIRQLTARLYPDESVSDYATVQKLLDRLETKRCVRRDRSGLAHVFHASLAREALIGDQLQEIADRMCEGSLAPVLNQLVQRIQLSPEQRDELRKLIDSPFPSRGVRAKVMEYWLEIGLSNALVATVLALAVWLFTSVWRRPQVAFALWMLVLVKLLSPPLLEIPLPAVRPEEPVDIVATEPEIEQAFELLALRAAVQDSQEVNGDHISEVSLGVPRDVRAVSPAAAAPQSVAAPPRLASDSEQTYWRADIHLPQAAGMIWLAGSLTWFCLVGVRCWRFSRLVDHTEPASEALLAVVAELASRVQLQRLPHVRVTSRAVPPLVWAALGRATLLLPADLLRSLHANERAALITHELVHLKRRDPWTGWFKLLALGCYWWHPVAWWASRQLERATELCCDERVVALRPEHARDYAKALLSTVEFLSPSRSPLPVGTQGFSRVPVLKRRLEMILSSPESVRVSWPLRAAMVLLGVCVLPLSLRALAAEPSAPAKASASALEQRLDRLEKMVETLTAEVRSLRDAQSDNAAPTVTKTVPENGAKGVDPGLTEIRVTFSKDMRDGSWSWTQRSDASYPEVTGKPHYVDKRTCVLPVKLEPGKTYEIGINSARFGNFKDPAGRSAVPLQLSFTTSP